MARAGESSIVSKCATVMDIISHARKPVAFSEIIEQSGFVKSSAHRILAVLQNEEMVEYNKLTRTYRVGSRLNDWARSSWRRADLQELASYPMQVLNEETNMNVALSLLDNDTVLYLKTVDSIRYRYASHPGDHVPLHSTAAGKVFLAFMDVKRRSELLSNLNFDRLTENTILDPVVLNRQLDEVLNNGYATAIGEEQLLVTGIAAPIFGADDKIAASLSLWALEQQFPSEKVINESPRLISAANQISSQLV